MRMFKYILRFKYIAGIDIVIIPNIRWKHQHNGFPEKIKRPMCVEVLGILLVMLDSLRKDRRHSSICLILQRENTSWHMYYLNCRDRNYWHIIHEHTGEPTKYCPLQECCECLLSIMHQLSLFLCALKENNQHCIYVY